MIVLANASSNLLDWTVLEVTVREGSQSCETVRIKNDCAGEAQQQFTQPTG
jgi:hypothetical protein